VMIASSNFESADLDGGMANWALKIRFYPFWGLPFRVLIWHCDVFGYLPTIHNMSWLCGRKNWLLGCSFYLCNLFFFFVYLVSTSGRTYQLQAKDKQTMMFWLQELQVMVLTLFFSSWAFGRIQLGNVFGKAFRVLGWDERKGLM